MRMMSPTLKTLKPAVFVSDIHLGAFSDEENTTIESDFIQLIRYCSQQKLQLFILGDLFDYWIEYPNDQIPSLGDNVIKELIKHRETIKPHFISGNHDNWTLGYFEKIGLSYFDQYIDIDHKVFLAHGDGFAKNSPFLLKRPFTHRVLRSKALIGIYRKVLTHKQAIAGMKWYSQRSAKKESEATRNPNRLNNWAKNFAKLFDYEVLICGHDHIPRIQKIDHLLYINCGPFFETRTIATYDGDQFQLAKWDAKKSSITPYKHKFNRHL